jgi:hypothetical protein
MRKSLLVSENVQATRDSDRWLDLEAIARVEMTSEDVAFPIEQALGEIGTSGWRAASKGPQVIRLHFDEPVALRRIQVHFVERAAERSQEFAIFVNGEDGELREVVRQQWGFSPGGSTEEIEDYTVALRGVTVLELRIDPDRSHDPAQSQYCASLASLKIA